MTYRWAKIEGVVVVGSKLRSERDEAVRQHTAIDSRVNDLQVGKDRGGGGW